MSYKRHTTREGEMYYEVEKKTNKTKIQLNPTNNRSPSISHTHAHVGLRACVRMPIHTVISEKEK